MEPDETKLKALKHERSLVLLKPDVVARHLVGEILARFERKGLKMVALKLVWPTQELAEQHYEVTEEWLQSSGQRTYDGYMSKGIKPTKTPRELALNTRRKLIELLTMGPVVAIVLEGAHVIEVVRKMRGNTSPLLADVGTIGFDYSLESYELSDAGDWAIKNIIHGSDSPESADREMKVWFKPEEILHYETVVSRVFYDKNWHKS